MIAAFIILSLVVLAQSGLLVFLFLKEKTFAGAEALRLSLLAGEAMACMKATTLAEKAQVDSIRRQQDYTLTYMQDQWAKAEQKEKSKGPKTQDNAIWVESDDGQKINLRDPQWEFE